MTTYKTPGDTLQGVQFLDKYARQRGRGRETWEQAVNRVSSYLVELSGGKLPQADYDFIHRMILEKKSMPSMRLLAMAGEAARRQNTTIYNCTYAPIIDLDVFREAVIILMSGAGFGYSVESKYIDKLPPVAPGETSDYDPSAVFVCPDTTEGWADAVSYGITSWMTGRVAYFDLSNIRAEGTPLKVKGGIASGPKHLERALEKIRAVILNRRGLSLRPIDAHDIMCHIADAVVSGGVRRSAMIALFDAWDTKMLTCKDTANLYGNEQRWNANNSLVLENEATDEWWDSYVETMNESGRGEPGIFSRYAVNKGDRSSGEWGADDWGTNPCGEIVLKPFQMCNLSSAVCRADDTVEALDEKVRAAAIIGTIQSLANYFPGLRGAWARNNADDRLLGLDLMGIMDCFTVRDPDVLMGLLDAARQENARVADILGINKAAAISCVKPSGNSSVLLNASPGIHARWSKYYIRRVTFVDKSPVRKALAAAGVPMERKKGTENQWVASFPIASPHGAIVAPELSAIDQLDNWLMFRRYWTDHNPSCTITYRAHELPIIAEWLRINQDMIGGLSFLPYFDAQYEQMPYEAIHQYEYERLLAEFPASVDLSNISGFVNVAATPACDGDVCELPPKMEG